MEFLENILAFFLKQDLVYSHQSLVEERLLDVRPQPERSYKLGYAHPSFRLSVSFLEIGSLVFTETKHDVMGPYMMVVCDRARFFGKDADRAKMV